MAFCVYLDLDGTALEADGRMSGDCREAIQSYRASGGQVTPASGRTADASMDVMPRGLSDGDLVFELGGGIMAGWSKTYPTTGLWSPTGTMTWDSTWSRVKASGAPDLLLERFAGVLEPHTPWNHPRRVTHIFRGDVDLDDANRVLEEAGFGSLWLLDNGPTTHVGTLDVAKPHVLHLAPRGVSKAEGVKAHQRACELDAGDCYMIGDTRADLGVSVTVNKVFIVANGPERDPSFLEDIGRTPNAIVTRGAYGAGVAEAIAAILGERS